MIRKEKRYVLASMRKQQSDSVFEAQVSENALIFVSVTFNIMFIKVNEGTCNRHVKLRRQKNIGVFW